MNFFENVDIAVKNDRVAIVSEAVHMVGKDTVVVDAESRYVVPSFLDWHVPTLTKFARACFYMEPQRFHRLA